MRQTILIALTLAACSSPEPEPATTEPAAGGETTGPTFSDDMQMICNAPEVLADELAEATPESRARLLADHIADRIQTDEAREFIGVFAGIPADRRASMLREAEGAPEPCAMAELYDAMTAEAGASASESAEGDATEEEPSVEAGGISGGGRERSVLARVIRRHINEVRYCYERQLVQEPDLEGNLVVRFTIQPDGSVGAVDITSGMHDAVDSCVVGRIRTWNFPAAEGITVVNYPFVFQHSED